MNAEERLLKAIFENEPQDENGELPDNYPDTNADKIGYALYTLTKSLESISPAIIRLNILESSVKVGCPDIIINNEAKMALRHLLKIKCDVNDVIDEVITVFDRTKIDSKY